MQSVKFIIISKGLGCSKLSFDQITKYQITTCSLSIFADNASNLCESFLNCMRRLRHSGLPSYNFFELHLKRHTLRMLKMKWMHLL